MITLTQFKDNLRTGQPVYIAIVGDSTTCGFGVNPGPNVWTNGIAYGCMNNPSFGPNWDAASQYYINTTGTPSQAQQDNVAIPSATRLMRTYVESKNSLSKVYNFGGSGYAADTHLFYNTVAAVAALDPKPQVVFLCLGINMAKQNQGQDGDLRALVAQVFANGMLPVMVIPNNIGVAYSPAGDWSADATPDQWYPMDNWPAMRGNIGQIAADNNLACVDLGTPDCALDVTKLYDPFHPNAAGYQEIFDKYKEWLESTVYCHKPLAVKFKYFPHSVASVADGPLRVKTTDGVACLACSLSDNSALRLKTSVGVAKITT